MRLKKHFNINILAVFLLFFSVSGQASNPKILSSDLSEVLLYIGQHERAVNVQESYVPRAFLEAAQENRALASAKSSIHSDSRKETHSLLRAWSQKFQIPFQAEESTEKGFIAGMHEHNKEEPFSLELQFSTNAADEVEKLFFSYLSLTGEKVPEQKYKVIEKTQKLQDVETDKSLEEVDVVSLEGEELAFIEAFLKAPKNAESFFYYADFEEGLVVLSEFIEEDFQRYTVLAPLRNQDADSAEIKWSALMLFVELDFEGKKIFSSDLRPVVDEADAYALDYNAYWNQAQIVW